MCWRTCVSQNTGKLYAFAITIFSYQRHPQFECEHWVWCCFLFFEFFCQCRALLFIEALSTLWLTVKWNWNSNRGDSLHTNDAPYISVNAVFFRLSTLLFLWQEDHLYVLAHFFNLFIPYRCSLSLFKCEPSFSDLSFFLLSCHGWP